MSLPRRKPWESGTTGESAGSVLDNIANVSSGQSSVSSGQGLATDDGAGVAKPERPAPLTSDLSSMSNTSPYGAGTGNYGTNYGSYGSRFGGGYGSSMYGSNMYGSSMYGNGLGGYGSGMYGMGGYGSGMYGMGGYGSGMYGQPGMMGGGGIAEGTQATFQLIESIIGAVGGFAQMLEATYMATHSSFFTMVSLAEQFGNLKNALGSLLGIYALINFAKKFFYKVTGKTYNHGINLKEFNKFESRQKRLEDNLKKSANGGKRISLKPLLLFLAASIGFPYLLSKAIQKLNQQQQRRLGQLPGQQPGGVLDPVNPSSLQFARALYDFNSENPNIEIDLKQGDLVAILSKLDPMGNESKWWKVRSRSGKVGYVPSTYLTVIERKKVAPAPQPLASPTSQTPELVQEFKKFNE